MTGAHLRKACDGAVVLRDALLAEADGAGGEAACLVLFVLERVAFDGAAPACGGQKQAAELVVAHAANVVTPAVVHHLPFVRHQGLEGHAGVGVGEKGRGQPADDLSDEELPATERNGAAVA